MPVLDAIRGVAALMVVGYHLVTWQSRIPPSDQVARGLATALRPGWFGVDLFFILSGFLITSILLATRKRPSYFTDFSVRRTLRILPLYYIFLLASGVALAALGTPLWSGVGIAAVFLANAVTFFGIGLLGPVLIALGARHWIELPIQRFRDRLAPRSIAPSPLLAPIGTRVLAD